MKPLKTLAQKILGWERSPGKEMATHSSLPACRIAWTEEAGGLQSMGSERVRHDWMHKHTQHCSRLLPLSLSWLFLLRVALLQAPTRSPRGLTGPWQDNGQPLLHFHRQPVSSWDAAPHPGAGAQAPGRLPCLWWWVPEGTILAAALLFLLAKRVGVQQAFAGERRQKIKLLKLQSCRQIERPPNSSELPNLDPSAHFPPRKW